MVQSMDYPLNGYLKPIPKWSSSMARKKARHRRAVFADMNRKLRKEEPAVCVNNIFYTVFNVSNRMITFRKML